ncbi:AI-2E family transporter [filamentous cyanobacterium LEGE 11480]|uniref:AI-2E family transporter n=1 Tax=Romeriopsis navalis LEGE 11480 TaxID=2777977 RepID=A0A928Z2I3_9CYAN|nr:AI-2E family transporter [Romeriopsis navalis]MBE9028415.1 AI-2E family transporter [Romeriopsis navalis LEGE 11480]
MKLGQWVGILALTLALYILWQIRSVLMLIFAAVVLATALNTLGQQIQQRLKLDRAISLMMAICGIVGLLALALWLVVPPFVDQFQELTQLVPQGVDRLDQLVKDFSNVAPPFLEPYLPTVEDVVQQLQPLANRLLGSSVTFVSGTLGGILDVLLVVILTLMLLFDPAPYRRAFIRVFPSFYRRRVQEILDKCGESLQGWLLGILFNMLVIGGLSGLGLLIAGIRLPLANGIFAGLLTFIPTIGPALSVVPPMAIALLDAPWKSLVVLGIYFVVQQLETNVLTPMVMAQQVALLPAVTLLSQVFFATFFGFLGLLLALPLTVVGQVWLQEVVVKDILDRWQEEEHPPYLSAAANLQAETSESEEEDDTTINIGSVMIVKSPTAPETDVDSDNVTDGTTASPPTITPPKLDDDTPTS